MWDQLGGAATVSTIPNSPWEYTPCTPRGSQSTWDRTQIHGSTGQSMDNGSPLPGAGAAGCGTLIPALNFPNPAGSSSCCHPGRFWLQNSTPCWIWVCFFFPYISSLVPTWNTGNEEVSSRREAGNSCIPIQQVIPHGNPVWDAGFPVWDTGVGCAPPWRGVQGEIPWVGVVSVLPSGAPREY